MISKAMISTAMISIIAAIPFLAGSVCLERQMKSRFSKKNESTGKEAVCLPELKAYTEMS